MPETSGNTEVYIIIFVSTYPAVVVKDISRMSIFYVYTDWVSSLFSFRIMNNNNKKGHMNIRTGIV